MKKKIFFWACDFSNSSGEGILGKSYLNYLAKNDKNIKLITLIHINIKKNLRKNNLS